MVTKEMKEVLREIGRRGGEATAKKLTKEQRRDNASKAGKASVEARRKKKREREQ